LNSFKPKEKLQGMASTAQQVQDVIKKTPIKSGLDSHNLIPANLDVNGSQRKAAVSRGGGKPYVHIQDETGDVHRFNLSQPKYKGSSEYESVKHHSTVKKEDLHKHEDLHAAFGENADLEKYNQSALEKEKARMEGVRRKLKEQGLQTDEQPSSQPAQPQKDSSPTGEGEQESFEAGLNSHKPKTSKGKISIADNSGNVHTPDSSIYHANNGKPLFAIHKNLNPDKNSHVLTHVPTGRSIEYGDKKHLNRMATALHKHHHDDLSHSDASKFMSDKATKERVRNTMTKVSNIYE
jgi:hypothetical protein